MILGRRWQTSYEMRMSSGREYMERGEERCIFRTRRGAQQKKEEDITGRHMKRGMRKVS